METIERTIMDVPDDILKKILSCIAASGAENFIKATASSKELKELSEDADILRTVKFEDVSVTGGRHVLFQQRDGLVSKCARAGNKQALFILGKVILLSSSQLRITRAARAHVDADSSSIRARNREILEQPDSVSSFMAYFMPEAVTCPTGEAPKSELPHFMAVKCFVQEASLNDFEEMEAHLKHYVYYIFRERPISSNNIVEWVNRLEFYSPALRYLLEPAGEATRALVQSYGAVVETIGARGEAHLSKARKIMTQYDLSTAVDSSNMEERISVNTMLWNCLLMLQEITDTCLRSKNFEQNIEWWSRYQRVMDVFLENAGNAEFFLTNLIEIVPLFESARENILSEFDSVFGLESSLEMEDER